MWVFENLVRSIILHAAEVWGWKEEKKIEKLQEKYIRWTLGLDFNTPAYIVLEETKVKKVRIDVGKRVVKYEEKTKENGINKILQESWKEIENKLKKNETKWEKTREEYYENIKMDMQEIESQRKVGRNWETELIRADEEKQREEIVERMKGGRYNKRYGEIREKSRPEYLKTGYKGRDQTLIGRFRCGNEENGNRYWRSEEENRCRMCQKGTETLEHILKDCEKTEWEESGRIDATEMLKKTEKGIKWMRGKKNKHAQKGRRDGVH